MPKTPRGRPQRGASYTRAHYTGVARCPDCGRELSQLPPVAQTSVELAELAARLLLGGSAELTSAALAEAYHVSLDYAGQLLRRAQEDGLLSRSRVRLPSGGGWEYRYWPTPQAPLYVRPSSLADNLTRLITNKERAQIAPRKE